MILSEGPYNTKAAIRRCGGLCLVRQVSKTTAAQPLVSRGEMTHQEGRYSRSPLGMCWSWAMLPLNTPLM